jgi:histidyl-tRNA synthetase
VLDCKVESCQPVIDSLPKITDHLGAEDRAHFDEVLRLLDAAGIAYVVTPRLVRGLDYYTRTTFEFTSERLGAQSTVLGGGRYDGLVKELGGPDAPGIGFALGVERLISIMSAPSDDASCDVFLIDLTPAARLDAIAFQRALRAQGVRAARDTEGRSFKSKMKQADRLNARLVLIRGDDEMKKGAWTFRDMKASSQRDVPVENAQAEVLAALRARE